MLIPARFRADTDDPKATGFSSPGPHSVTFELVGQRKDGTEFPVEMSVSPIEDENRVLVDTAIRDITDRKHAERMLAERQEELAHVTRLATMGEMVAGVYKV